MNEKEQEMMTRAKELFMRYGIKSLTMDDLARHLRISKKTLYQMVKDKDELVLRAVVYEQMTHIREIDKIGEQKFNAIDEMIAVSREVSGRFKHIHPSIFYDLQKYHPAAWDEFIDFKMNYIYSCLKSNVERGQKEGFYRKDLNSDISARLWISRIDELMDPEQFPPGKYKFHELYVEMLRHHIRGLSTIKGVEYLAARLEKEGTGQL